MLETTNFCWNIRRSYYCGSDSLDKSIRTPPRYFGRIASLQALTSSVLPPSRSLHESYQTPQPTWFKYCRSRHNHRLVIEYRVDTIVVAECHRVMDRRLKLGGFTKARFTHLFAEADADRRDMVYYSFYVFI